MRLSSSEINDLDSVLLLVAEQKHRKSDAILRALTLLPLPWNLATFLRIFPRFFRDAVYDFVVRNRYEWFGKRESCRLPSPEERSRFLD